MFGLGESKKLIEINIVEIISYFSSDIIDFYAQIHNTVGAVVVIDRVT